jgi:hypothetical protein
MSQQHNILKQRTVYNLTVGCAWDASVTSPKHANTRVGPCWYICLLRLLHCWGYTVWVRLWVWAGVGLMFDDVGRMLTMRHYEFLLWGWVYGFVCNFTLQNSHCKLIDTHLGGFRATLPGATPSPQSVHFFPGESFVL